MNKNMEKQNKMIQYITHDLRTPLNCISQMLELLSLECTEI